jgi:hypothetical protein
MRAALGKDSAWVVSTAAAALIASGVGLAFKVFAEQPIEAKAKHAVALQRQAREAYEDSRRMLVDYRAALNKQPTPGGPAVPLHRASVSRKLLQRAAKLHIRAWRLMQAAKYREAIAGFHRAQDVLSTCGQPEQCMPVG